MLYFLGSRKYAEVELAQIWMDQVREVFGLNEDDGPRRLTLGNVVRFVMRLTREKPSLMIVDECQALDSVAPAFWADLQGVWDLGKDDSRVLLMMGGSVTSTMRRIFDDAGEPLFGRQDLSLTLRPFTPGEMRTIFLDLNPRGSADDLITFHAVTGGVPGYAACLADRTPLTREDLLRWIFSEEGAAFRTEGDMLLATDFRTESSVYERILRAAAFGAETWTAIGACLQGQNLAGYMDRLENRYGLLAKRPALFASGTRGLRYGIADPYFRFWFRFVEPVSCRQWAERGRWDALRENCLRSWDAFTEGTLADWFRQIYGADPRWTMADAWWDRQGGNAVDLVELNEWTQALEMADVRRLPERVDLKALARKAEVFRKACAPQLQGYGEPRLRGLTLEDVLKAPEEL